MVLRIGALADATGTTAATIRYYEEIGLLPVPGRVGGQRRYDDADVRRVTFIRRCRDFDFSIEQVRSLVDLIQADDRSCVEARDLAQAHVAEVRAQLVELHALERSIADLIEAADANCDGPGSECRVLERLAEPTTR